MMTALHITPRQTRPKPEREPYPLDDSGSEDGLQVSEETYWEKYYNHPDFNYEWNNGVLEEKPVTNFVEYALYLWFIGLLNNFLLVYPTAKTIGLEMGFRLDKSSKLTIRKPDLGLILNDNIVLLEDEDRSYVGTFDLCIESISSSSQKEIERDTIQKKREYEKAGVLEYYVLDDKQTHTAFYQLNKAGFYEPILPDKHGLIHSGILPGFQFRVADLYRQPLIRDMVEDEVYQAFILPYYQAEKKRADQAEKARAVDRKRADQESKRADQTEKARAVDRKRADQEKERADQAEKALILEREQVKQEKGRADQEKERADRLVAKLKALGISLD